MRIRTHIWKFIVHLYPWVLKNIYKMDIGRDVIISYKAYLDLSVNPKGIHIGDRVWINSGVRILSHDYSQDLVTDTYIGNDSFIGIGSIILPGVTIGKEVIIGAGSIVTKDIPDGSIAVGNPAKIIRSNIHVHNGKIIEIK